MDLARTRARAAKHTRPEAASPGVSRRDGSGVGLGLALPGERRTFASRRRRSLPPRPRRPTTPGRTPPPAVDHLSPRPASSGYPEDRKGSNNGCRSEIFSSVPPSRGSDLRIFPRVSNLPDSGAANFRRTSDLPTPIAGAESNPMPDVMASVSCGRALLSGFRSGFGTRTFLHEVIRLPCRNYKPVHLKSAAGTAGTT